jgi:hypothetical protein
MLREIFSDNNEHLSSKRIMGALLLIAAIAIAVTADVDADIVKTMIWAGVAALGVGTLETKVNK